MSYISVINIGGTSYDIKAKAVESSALTNYYTKSEVDTAITNKVTSFVKIQVASSLPSPSALYENFVYLVPSDNSVSNNNYDEYICVSGGSGHNWELIGNTSFDSTKLGALANKSSASGSYTPTGTNVSATPTATFNVTLLKYLSSGTVLTGVSHVTLHDTPTLNTERINYITNADNSKIFTVNVSGETLNFLNNTSSVFSTGSINVGTSLTPGIEQNVVKTVTSGTGLLSVVSTSGSTATEAIIQGGSVSVAAHTHTFNGDPAKITVS